MSRIRVAFKAPCEPARALETDDTLEALQALVGGYLELVRFVVQVGADDYVELDLYLNEEGRNEELAPNIVARGEVIVGPVFVATADAAGDTIGLSDLQLSLALDILGAAALDWRASAHVKPEAIHGPAAFAIAPGPASATTTGVERGIDVAFLLTLDGIEHAGEVTLLPHADGSPGFGGWGSVDNWLDGRTVDLLRELGTDEHRAACNAIIAATAPVAAAFAAARD